MTRCQVIARGGLPLTCVVNMGRILMLMDWGFNIVGIDLSNYAAIHDDIFSMAVPNQLSVYKIDHSSALNNNNPFPY